MQEMGINCLKIVFINSVRVLMKSGHAGFLNLRLRLNGGLLNYAGHIGYSIRPSARGQVGKRTAAARHKK